VSRLQALARNPWARGLFVLASLVGALLAIWWRGPEWDTVYHAFDFVSWRWVVVGVLLNLLSVLARALSWNLTIHQALAPPLPRFSQVFSAFGVGLLGNAVLPARAGELARVAVLRRHLPGRPGTSATLLGTVFAHRLFDLFPIALLVAYVLATAKIPHWAVTGIVVVGLVGLALLTVGVISARRARGRVHVDGLGTVRRLLEMARQGLAVLRTELVPPLADRLPGAEVAVTGDTAGSADFTATLSSHLPLVFGFVLVVTFLVLVLAFRSVVVAATAVALNLLSVGAAYGLMVLVFQHGAGADLLGVQESGFVVDWVPLFLFVILFGLSMDYHVFVVSRIREAHELGAPTREAVSQGVTRSAGVVTSAAAVMIGVFSIFATLSLIEFEQMGVGLAAAVLIDATIVRAVLLPATMAVLGRRNWWLPRSLDRVLPAAY